jgi:hypothetical protein
VQEQEEKKRGNEGARKEERRLRSPCGLLFIKPKGKRDGALPPPQQVHKDDRYKCHE